MRTVVVGLGWVATQVWLPRIVAHPAYELTAVVDPVVTSVDLADPPPLYRDYREVTAGPGDVVFVLTPNHTHADIGEWFLRRGCGVVLEKPSCAGLDEVDRLAAAAGEGGGWLGLSAAARHRPDVAVLRDIVATGQLGTPRLAELSWVRASGIPGRAWFTRRDAAGGGVLVDLGWHVLDVVHDLWGPVRTRDAAAQMTADFLRRGAGGAAWQPGDRADPGATGDVEDQLDAILTTDRFALRLRFAWASHEEVDRTTIALHGTDATVELHATFGFSPLRVHRPTVWFKRGGRVQDVPVPAAAVGEEYDRQLDEYVDAGADPSTTVRSLAAIRNVRAIVDACYAAASWPQLPNEVE